MGSGQFGQSALVNESGELAWQYPLVLEVVAALVEQGYAVLGGDVMHEAGEKLEYFREETYCGNWFFTWKDGELWAAYV